METRHTYISMFHRLSVIHKLKVTTRNLLKLSKLLFEKKGRGHVDETTPLHIFKGKLFFESLQRCIDLHFWVSFKLDPLGPLCLMHLLNSCFYSF